MTIYSKPAVAPAWGETNTTATDMVQPLPAEIQTGWAAIATPPSRQRFNWLFNWITQGIRYFMQRGLVDYDASETYQLNARIIGNDGRTYTSLQANNTGNTPSTSASWWLRWGYTADDLANFIFVSPLAAVAPPLNDSTALIPNTWWTGRAISNAVAPLALQTWVNNNFDTISDVNNKLATQIPAAVAPYAPTSWVQGNFYPAWTTDARIAAAIAPLSTQAWTEQYFDTISDVTSKVNGAIASVQSWTNAYFETLADTAARFASFSMYKSQNGYVKIPIAGGGFLVLQWMQGYTDNGSASTQYISWPIAFTGGCFMAQASCSSQQAGSIITRSYQVNSFTNTYCQVALTRRGDDGSYPTVPFIFGIGTI